MSPGSTRSLDTGGRQPLRPGDLAPPFELRQTFERNISLDDLIAGGPVLIAFYVFDFGNV